MTWRSYSTASDPEAFPADLVLGSSGAKLSGQMVAFHGYLFALCRKDYAFAQQRIVPVVDFWLERRWGEFRELEQQWLALHSDASRGQGYAAERGELLAALHQLDSWQHMPAMLATQQRYQRWTGWQRDVVVLRYLLAVNNDDHVLRLGRKLFGAYVTRQY